MNVNNHGDNLPTTQSPQTPIGGPPSLNPDADLPPELVAAGWRKFWSKREQRVYFWNRLSGESLWDMPPPTTMTIQSSSVSFIFVRADVIFFFYRHKR